MRLTKLAKDHSSGNNGCQTVYAIDELPNSVAIQGDQADAETMANLENVLDGENAVIIKREVLEEALRRLREQQEGGTS